MALTVRYFRPGVRRVLQQDLWLPSHTITVDIWCDLVPDIAVAEIAGRKMEVREWERHTLHFLAPAAVVIQPVKKWLSDSQGSGNRSQALYPWWFNSPEDGQDIVFQLLRDGDHTSKHRHHKTGEAYAWLDNPGNRTILYIRGRRPQPLRSIVSIPIGLGHAMCREKSDETDFGATILSMRNPTIRFPDRSDHLEDEFDCFPPR